LTPEYNGPESNRTSEDNLFLVGIKSHIKNIIINEGEDREVTVLDIGCGTEAKLLNEIAHDIDDYEFANRKLLNYSLHGISNDSHKKDERIIHYNNFLRASKGLKFLPEDLKFDYIYSSWCMNYFGPNTFRVVLQDCLDRMKDNTQIDIYPFQPLRNSAAFPYGLNISHELRELFYEKGDKKVDIIKKRMSHLAAILKIEIEDIEGVEDHQTLQQFFNKYFTNEDIIDVSENLTAQYSKKIFKHKEEVLEETLGDRFTTYKYKVDNLIGINIRRTS